MSWIFHSCVDNALFRLYASRGPGGFTPNPYASIGPQLYLVISALKSKPEALYKGGAKIGFSKVAVKSGGMARYQQTLIFSEILRFLSFQIY